MTISGRVETSHSHSFRAQVKEIFRVTLVAESMSRTKGFHYIVMMDTSGSMAGEKLALAKKGAEEYVRKIPPGNVLSFLTFSDSVKVTKEVSATLDLSDSLPMVETGGETKLYTALQAAFDLARRREVPGWIVILTDGEPTDVMQPEMYRALKIPKGFQLIEFGIGNDYNEGILKALADASGGSLFYIPNPSELPSMLEKSAVEQVAAKNVKVEFLGSSAVSLLNYQGPPANINAVSGATKIWGDVIIPANHSGQIAEVRVSYDDDVDGKRKEFSLPIAVSASSSEEEFMSGVNKALISEFKYYQGLEQYYKDLASGKLREAEKTMKLMTLNAEQTRRTDLIEVTKRLSSNLEMTKKLGGSTEMTKNLSKEAASEATKKARGS